MNQHDGELLRLKGLTRSHSLISIQDLQPPHEGSIVTPSAPVSARSDMAPNEAQEPQSASSHESGIPLSSSRASITESNSSTRATSATLGDWQNSIPEISTNDSHDSASAHEPSGEHSKITNKEDRIDSSASNMTRGVQKLGKFTASLSKLLRIDSGIRSGSPIPKKSPREPEDRLVRSEEDTRMYLISSLYQIYVNFINPNVWFVSKLFFLTQRLSITDLGTTPPPFERQAASSVELTTTGHTRSVPQLPLFRSSGNIVGRTIETERSASAPRVSPKVYFFFFFFFFFFF